MRGFVMGVFWGAVVAGGGLAVVSLVAAPPAGVVPMQPPVPEVAAPVAAPTAPAAEPPAAEAPGSAPPPALSPDQQAALEAEAAEEGGAMFDPGALPGVAAVAPPDAAEAEAKATEAAAATPTEPLIDKPEVAANPAAVTAEPAKPEPGLGGAVEGVTTGRLPAIASNAAPAGETLEKLPDAAPAEGAAGATTEAPAWQRFAAPFSGGQDKPLFAVIVIDDGAPDLDRAALAALPFPAAIAIDPTTSTASEAMAIYRKAGREVLMLATAIPKGANAQDLAVTFDSHARALPEAFAVLDPGPDQGGFQANRPVATEAVPVIKDQGRAVITWDEGLNAGDQVARREGVPSALIYRRIDGAGETPQLMRRYLDRAVFKAAQDGQVIIAAGTAPETLAALLEWSVEGRAGTVTLAPVSALLTQD